MNYVIWLSYDGTRYDGWQKQGSTDKTIQGKLEEILKHLDEAPVKVRGSGRTDIGVYTLTQTADFRLNRGIVPRDMMEYLNRYLPEDIGVWKVEKAPERFHSRLNTMRKTYRYQIEIGPKKDVSQRGYYYGLDLGLDVKAMGQAADPLTGTRDLKSSCSNKKMKKPTMRTLEFVQFEHIGNTKLHISFTGNGFLQQMVRILTGTLIEAGLGRRQPGNMSRTLEAKNRQEVGFTTSSQGLFLEKVEYGGLRRQIFQ